MSGWPGIERRKPMSRWISGNSPDEKTRGSGTDDGDRLAVLQVVQRRRDRFRRLDVGVAGEQAPQLRLVDRAVADASRRRHFGERRSRPATDVATVATRRRALGLVPPLQLFAHVGEPLAWRGLSSGILESARSSATPIRSQPGTTV